MIEPELFNFKPPLSKHVYVKKRWNKLLERIDEYGLTHSISVILPDTIFLPSYIENVFSESGQYYFIKDVTLASLIDSGFISSFVKNGKLYAISLNTEIDIEDCVSITNNNVLQMSLIQSSYQNMCLPIKDSKIKLDLNDIKFTSKFYQRLKECFQRYQTKFDLLISWEPNNEDVCPSSIASYFDKKGFVCHECQPRSTKKIKYNMTIPTGLDITFLDTWLSYFCLDINIEKVSNILPCGSLTKSNSCNVGQVTQITWTGFFSNDNVKLLIEKLRDFMVKEKKLHWLAIHLEPISNSPHSCAHQTLIFNLDDTYYVSYCTKCKKN